jgi:hypothetical protein
MKKQTLTAIEIEALAQPTSTAPDERCEPVSLDGGDYPSEPEIRGRAALRWFIETLAFAGAGMAGVYVGVWLDPPNGAVTLPCEERERSTPYGSLSRRDGLTPRGHRRGAQQAVCLG